MMPHEKDCYNRGQNLPVLLKGNPSIKDAINNFF
jgi:hypothetical protein